MKTKLAVFVIIGIALALTGCDPAAALTATATPSPPSAAPPPTETPVPLTEIVMDTVESFNVGDMDGTMSHWADDAIFYMFGMPPTGTEIAAGKAQIRTMYEENIASHSQWEVEIVSIVGNVVNIRSKNWHDFTRQIGVAPLEADGLFVIEDGVITVHVWNLTQDSVTRLRTAVAEAMAAEQAAAGEADVEEAIAAPAESPATELTVNIANEMCSYEGSLALQAGEVALTVEAEESDKQAYAVIFFTLEPGKDFLDLMASTLGSRPSWADEVPMTPRGVVSPGSSRSYKLTVTDGPIYGVCWSREPAYAIGSIGPFVVNP